MHVRISDSNKSNEGHDRDSGNLEKDSGGVNTSSGDVRPHNRANFGNGQYRTHISTENIRHR